MSEPKRTQSSDTVPIPISEVRARLGENVRHISSVPPPDGRLVCPECWALASDPPCTSCWGVGHVDAAAFARFHARTQGRP